MFESARIEVHGAVVKAYFDAFKIVPRIPQEIFAKHGVGRLGPGGSFEIDFSAPFPFAAILAGAGELAQVVGPKKAFEVGLEVIKHAVIPPGATDIVSAMKLLDVGYHLNHLRGGAPMFDPKTGRMQEGIGHYRCAAVADKRITMEVDAPYPCDIDRGIMQAWAGRFQRGAVVTHVEPAVCRKTGAPRCRYEVTWK